jgi:hypothetical protein
MPTSAFHALLQVPGLVHDQDRARIGERVDHVAAQIITHQIGVPPRSGQQMLQPVRGQIATMLGDRPAILTIQPGQHAQHQPGGVPQRLVAGEARLNPVQHRAERLMPPDRIYAMSRGHRGETVVPHKHRTLARWPPHLQQKRRPTSASTSKITIYGCSTRRHPCTHRRLTMAELTLYSDIVCPWATVMVLPLVAVGGTARGIPGDRAAGTGGRAGRAREMDDFR